MKGGEPALLVLLTMCTTAPLCAQCPDGSPPPCTAPVARTTPAPAPNSVAVLYFDNLSRDTAEAYLADGLTEELIVRLGQIGRLQVASRNAVRRFRTRADEEPAALGRTLRVAHLVSGSVRRAGQRLRVTAELTRASDARRLWGDAYEGDASDLLAFEQRIATSVATTVAGQLLPRERATLSAQPTRSPEAYDYFLRGNHLLAQRTSRAVARSIEQYEAAVRADPGFVRALARIGFAYAVFYGWEWPHPGLARDSALTRAFVASERALRRDSAASDAWLARGLVLIDGYPSGAPGARASLERALALDPRNAEAHHTYGWHLLLLGETEGALAEFQRALSLDPERPVTRFYMASAHYGERRFEEARRMADSAIAVDQGFHAAYAMRALVQARLGALTAARADAQTALRLSEPGMARWLAAIAWSIVRLGEGDTAAVRRDLAQLGDDARAADPRAVFPRLALAAIHAALGETDHALAALDPGLPRDPRIGLWLLGPEYDSLRSNPRFQRLVEEARPR